jgi:hypothetical protein
MIQAYNPHTGEWKISGEMKASRYGFAADILDENYVLSCGGIWDNETDLLSIETWNSRSHAMDSAEIISYDINFNRIFFTGHIYQGKFYLIGGYSDQVIDDLALLPFIVIYDVSSSNVAIAENTIYQNNFLPYHHTSVRIDSIIYILGGVHFSISNHISTFNLRTHEFRHVGSLKSVRAGSQAVAWRNRIYLIGGYGESSEALRSMEIYHYARNSSEIGANLNHYRNELMAVVFENMIYVFGGKDRHGQTVSSIERLDPVTHIESHSEIQVTSFQLNDNYPDPFNAGTVIEFDVAHASELQLDIYSITGQHINNLAKAYYQPGHYKIHWDATDEYHTSVASGIYIYRLQTPNYMQSKKMILIR